MARLRQKLTSGLGEGGGAPAEEEEPTLVLSEKMAVFIVIQATCGLLIMYFLLSNIFFKIILVFYALISTQAIWVQATFLFEYLSTKRRMPWMERSINLPLLGSCQVYQLACLVLGLAVSVTWAVVRTRANWAWVLQDVSGICIILTILAFLKLPNLKIACILLPLIMMYDVFFVYIQPLIFHNESVMKKVATGGSTHEILPMALILPNLGTPGAYSMLGYGDIALPGLLLVYAASFDEVHRLGGALKSYFWMELAGYVLGLLCTYGALALDIGGQQGQPALLYLVPTTLVPILVASHVRGHLGDMFYSNLAFLDDAQGGVSGHGGGAEDRELLLAD